MKLIRFLSSYFSILLLISCGDNSSDKSKIKTAGQSLYESNCTACHGNDGKLCSLGAKDLSVSTFSKEQMEEIIINGKSTMTPFGSILSKEEISAIADYVETLKVN